MAGSTISATSLTVRAGVLLALVGCLLAAPDAESDLSVPAARRFHAKFVVDRIEPRRPPSTDDRSTPAVVVPAAGTTPVPTPARTRSTTRCREGCLQKCMPSQATACPCGVCWPERGVMRFRFTSGTSAAHG
uniref:Uncharacterized protein n=1 Tax=Anopheles coluzzii TaxID=1518534 RepID=A0A8W7PYD3_ANOCL